MLEQWNYGIVSPKEMEPWFVGKITLTWQSEILVNEKFPVDPPAADHYSSIPLFQV